jgi:hypothetical protein
MRIQPEIDKANIVFIGDFNPRIFRADWFEAHGLLPEEEVASAEIEIVHPDLSRFSTDWLVIQVERHRFLAETLSNPQIRLADLVVRLFGEFLSHTPVGLVGINRIVHFAVKDLDMRDRIGERLAPQDAWGEWANRIKGTPERHGGMQSITMQQVLLDDREDGYIRAKVEPSTISKSRFGVCVDINDHYAIGDPSEATDCEKAVSIISDRFESSMKRSAWIVDQVMALARTATND